MSFNTKAFVLVARGTEWCGTILPLAVPNKNGIYPGARLQLVEGLNMASSTAVCEQLVRNGKLGLTQMEAL